MKNFFVFSIISLIFSYYPALGEEFLNHNDELILVNNIDEEQLEQLENLAESIDKAENFIKQSKSDEVRHLKEKVDLLREDFLSLSTGVDWRFFKEEGQLKSVDLIKELQELITPLLETLKHISERPRRIEMLKRELRFVEGRYSLIEKGIDRLHLIKEKITSKKGTKEIFHVSEMFERKKKELDVDKEIIQSKLDFELKQKKSLFGEISSLFQDFLKSKGKNLFIAFLVFFFVWGFFFIPQRYFFASYFEQSEMGQKFNMNLFYSWFSFSCATISAVMALYLLNDWLLVTVCTLLFFSFIWSMRQILPRFFQEIKLILNFGTVKEGEVVSFQGVLWRVKKLGLYTILENELLEGGLIKVSAKELLGMQGRRYPLNIPLFPAKKEDWVLFKDVLTRVVHQTPELVCLKRFDGTQEVVKTGDFLSADVQNLSTGGFSLFVHFGLDYSLQEIFFSEVLPKVKKHFERIFHEKLMSKEIYHLEVDFVSASASSLDVVIILRCHQILASHYMILERRIKGEMVKLCNQENWVIPFGQLTVHLEGKSSF